MKQNIEQILSSVQMNKNDKADLIRYLNSLKSDESDKDISNAVYDEKVFAMYPALDYMVDNNLDTLNSEDIYEYLGIINTSSSAIYNIIKEGKSIILEQNVLAGIIYSPENFRYYSGEYVYENFPYRDYYFNISVQYGSPGYYIISKRKINISNPYEDYGVKFDAVKSTWIYNYLETINDTGIVKNNQLTDGNGYTASMLKSA